MKLEDISKTIGNEDLKLHNEISALRNYNKPLNDKHQEIINANWQEIINLSEQGLKKSCDLTLAARLTEALVFKNGIDGLLEGIKVIKHITDNNYYPNNTLHRERILELLDQKLPIIAFYHKQIGLEKQESNILEEIKSKLKVIYEILGSMKINLSYFKSMTNNLIDKIDKIIFFKINEMKKKISKNNKNNSENFDVLMEKIRNLKNADQNKIRNLLKNK